MPEPDEPPPDAPDPLALGQAAASQLGGEWQIDVVEELAEDLGEQESESDDKGNPREVPPHKKAAPQGDENQEAKTTHDTTHDASPTRDTSGGPPPPLAEVPPSPEQLVEAMLFVGGSPLTAEIACAAVRGLTAERFQLAVDALNRRYRDQWRPYAIEPRDDGFVMLIRPAYRNLRERLFGGPRETRLSQPALDVLSVVAYRQPVGKAEVDAVRGTDSGATLRQLVRLGLVTVQHRADATGREVRYGTTPRFLSVFGLTTLDELPRLGDPAQV